MIDIVMTLERRHFLITVLKPRFLPTHVRFTYGCFKKAIDDTFYGFTGVITHLGCWEKTHKAYKSRAELFEPVLPRSQVGYHAGKPIESVVYCFNILLTVCFFSR